jgi:hypothetical protein
MTEGRQDRVRRGPLGVLWRQWPLLLVLGVGSGGLVTVARGGFRLGCILLGAAVLAAAVARVLLPARRVGLLVVRSRVLDVLVLLVLGLGLVVVAAVVPPARG